MENNFINLNIEILSQIKNLAKEKAKMEGKALPDYIAGLILKDSESILMPQNFPLQCKRCKHIFYASPDDADPYCPACGGRDVRNFCNGSDNYAYDKKSLLELLKTKQKAIGYILDELKETFEKEKKEDKK